MFIQMIQNFSIACKAGNLHEALVLVKTIQSGMGLYLGGLVDEAWCERFRGDMDRSADILGVRFNWNGFGDDQALIDHVDGDIAEQQRQEVLEEMREELAMHLSGTEDLDLSEAEARDLVNGWSDQKVEDEYAEIA